jgi:hypothetical protein
VRLQPGLPVSDWEAHLWQAHAASVAEGKFIEQERRKIAHLAATAPANDVGAFIAWFDELRISGPGQYDPLFDFLAERATYDQLRWFIQQEVAGEAGFDDLVALTQIKMPEQAKLEFARNYWDEMGKGKSAGMHGPMLTRLAKALTIPYTPAEDIVWESLALANLLVGLAHNRRYAFHAVGALGGVELTSPTRAVRVVEALDRLKVSKQASHYFRLHASVDVAHSREWKKEILVPLLNSTPEVGIYIAEGALMRLNAGARTFDRYRAEFGIIAPKAEIE